MEAFVVIEHVVTVNALVNPLEVVEELPVVAFTPTPSKDPELIERINPETKAEF